MKRVLILDGSIYPDIYSPVTSWRGLLGGVPSDAVHLPSGDEVPPLDGYSHLILTGSEASITRPAPWYEVEARAAREAAERGLAILGSCFGHQMLARTLSGERHVAASPTPENGWIEIEVLADDHLLAGVPRPFFSFAAHFDEVREPPAPWRVLARSAGCAVQVMRYGTRPIWGVQAHPEIDPVTARELLCGLLPRFPDQARLLEPAIAATPRDDRAGATLVRNFIELD